MSIYTILPDFFSKVEKEEGVYFSDILFVFTQRGNSFKVTKDKKGEVISIYSSIKENADIIKSWLEMMSFKPSTFEKIDVDISGIDCMETKFVKICKETKGVNKLIVYTRQNIRKFKCENNILTYEGTDITVLDKDDAHIELSKTVNKGDVIINSQVAKDGSQINKSKN